MLQKKLQNTDTALFLWIAKIDQKTEKKWLEEVKNQHMKGLVLVPVCSENKELRGALQELEEQGFMGRLFGSKPQQNAFAEINNILTKAKSAQELTKDAAAAIF